MTRDKWLQIVTNTEQQCRIIEKTISPLTDEKLPWYGKGELALDDDEVLPETVDRLVFDGPQGVMKFEFYRHPRFIKEKTLFAKRLTSNVTVEKIYQTNDVVSVFKAFRKSTHGWEEMKTE